MKHQGVGCVRDASREAILAADKEARKHYIEFGTENGYPSAYAMVKSQHLSNEAIKYGVDGEGDIPSNWCSVYMRSMLCQVAFPQVCICLLSFFLSFLLLFVSFPCVHHHHPPLLFTCFFFPLFILTLLLVLSCHQFFFLRTTGDP